MNKQSEPAAPRNGLHASSHATSGNTFTPQVRHSRQCKTTVFLTLPERSEERAGTHGQTPGDCTHCPPTPQVRGQWRCPPYSHLLLQPALLSCPVSLIHVPCLSGDDAIAATSRPLSPTSASTLADKGELVIINICNY